MSRPMLKVALRAGSSTCFKAHAESTSGAPCWPHACVNACLKGSLSRTMPGFYLEILPCGGGGGGGGVDTLNIKYGGPIWTCKSPIS